ncbi:uncharacterized protein LOC133199778 [Saccostrea echinata]|uniref:uncharacterized protein LOC133199778 n=1 Tax=Saccostrea echinata TaxID=191078 RepID=UPI002A81752B|nr:uncharacterized protein LOC133199778 [Saccostrea echinata]
MEPLRNEGTDLPLSFNTTVEDVLNYQKSQIQTFLRVNHIKVSGNKLELAQRVVKAIKDRSCTTPSQIPPHQSCQTSGLPVPDIKDLDSGWAGKSDMFPNIKIQDVENYLIHSSHRTVDAKKMQCYRQYIRGLNFFKEGYIHKIMMNEISPDSGYCYIRSKCYPSMKQGVYEQWILMTKKPPFHVQRASCTCPAGLGEGCTHVAGLLFALEGRPVTDDDVPCTSKPCEWNRPSKRKKDTKPVQDMSFKKIKLSGENVKNKKNVNYKVDSIKFRNSLCAKLGNNSRAAIFYILPPCANNNIDVQSDLNIGHFEEVETSDHIFHLSDKYIALQKTVQDENMSQSDFLTFISTCSQEIVDEIEVRTKGQHNNPLWVSARAARITASNFHEIKTKKDSTKSENITCRLLGHGKPLENSAVHWGLSKNSLLKKGT